MPYKLKRRGKTVWRGQVRLENGTARQKQFATKAEAQEWEVKTREEQRDPSGVTPSAYLTVLDWISGYLLYCERFSKKVRSEKYTELKKFINSGVVDPHGPIEAITPHKALNYLQQVFTERSGYAANSKARKNLCAAWNYGVKFAPHFPYAVPNPFKLVPRFPEQPKPRKVPSEADFWKVFHCSKDQDRTMLVALFCTAARKGELFRWRWSEDIDFQGRQVRLGSRKNREGTMVYHWLPMVDDLYNALLEHRKKSINDVVFFQTVGRHHGKPYVENRDFPQALCREAGVSEFGCHAIRHLAATIMARRGVPTTYIQAILRHNKLSTTENYIQSLQTDDLRPHLLGLEKV